jgi:hypothetical protein
MMEQGVIWNDPAFDRLGATLRGAILTPRPGRL